ncbi:hypothetical protein QAD02_013221 [Eretmocerus hayati]|uniref:Uncharacterized protein n=1 Tax=Eretmocerus hayati TaxID=131215 RepID=A0ACC2P4I3_9HYME|nr:hypothetical protein QAD02_013221 [Eretmocerus hayati]
MESETKRQQDLIKAFEKKLELYKRELAKYKKGFQAMDIDYARVNDRLDSLGKELGDVEEDNHEVGLETRGLLEKVQHQNNLLETFKKGTRHDLDSINQKIKANKRIPSEPQIDGNEEKIKRICPEPLVPYSVTDSESD